MRCDRAPRRLVLSAGVNSICAGTRAGGLEDVNIDKVGLLAQKGNAGGMPISESGSINLAWDSGWTSFQGGCSATL